MKSLLTLLRHVPTTGAVEATESVALALFRQKFRRRRCGWVCYTFFKTMFRMIFHRLVLFGSSVGRLIDQLIDAVRLVGR